MGFMCEQMKADGEINHRRPAKVVQLLSGNNFIIFLETQN